MLIFFSTNLVKHRLISVRVKQNILYFRTEGVGQQVMVGDNRLVLLDVQLIDEIH